MHHRSDRFPLLRFIAWFSGLLAVATLLALLTARAEADAGDSPAPTATAVARPAGGTER